LPSYFLLLVGEDIEHTNVPSFYPIRLLKNDELCLVDEDNQWTIRRVCDWMCLQTFGTNKDWDPTFDVICVRFRGEDAGTVEIFNATGVLSTKREHPGVVDCLGIDAGARLVTYSQSGEVRVWKLDLDECRLESAWPMPETKHIKAAHGDISEFRTKL
jgi:hypothetical protein